MSHDGILLIGKWARMAAKIKKNNKTKVTIVIKEKNEPYMLLRNARKEQTTVYYTDLVLVLQ